MGSKNSKVGAGFQPPTYRRVGDGGHAAIAVAVPNPRGSAPMIEYQRRNDEGIYVRDQEYYDKMEELLKNNGAGVWDKRPEGYRGGGNIDVRMQAERDDRPGGQHGERGGGREGRGEERVPAGLRGDENAQRGGGRDGREQRGEERVPAGLRENNGGQRVYGSAGGRERERGRTARDDYDVDRRRKAFVRHNKRAR